MPDEDSYELWQTVRVLTPLHALTRLPTQVLASVVVVALVPAELELLLELLLLLIMLLLIMLLLLLLTLLLLLELELLEGVVPELHTAPVWQVPERPAVTHLHCM
jgi:hypothetical protein